MPLLRAVKNGDLVAIQRELTNGADVNEADETGCTPLMWAARHGQEETVRLLLDKDATLDLSNRSGKTVLDLAANAEILAILQENQTKRHHATMGEFPELCAGAMEVRQMSEHVFQRLLDAQTQLEGTADAPKPATKSLFQAASSFRALLLQHRKKLTLERLVSTRTVVNCLRELHCDIDALFDHLPARFLHPAWQEQWEQEERAVNDNLILSLEAAADHLQQELSNPVLQAEALKLLRYESEEHEHHYGPRVTRILEGAQTKLIRLSGLSVPDVPNWFIPDYEVQRQATPFARGGFGAVYRGSWLESQVIVKCVDVKTEQDKRTFRREAKIWQRARHRHIVNFFGACDQGSPWFFVCEEAANGNLKDFLYRRRHQPSVAWRKLHEAALGLHFLHQRHIVHSDLKCNQILVSAEGVAMLTDFGLSFISADSRPQAPPDGAIRWKAPECLQSADTIPTPESDVYSFGMCVVEAVSGEHPWGQIPDPAVLFHVRRKVPLPKPKGFKNDEHWQFVKALIAAEPSKRMKLPDAIRLLKKFADQERSEERLLRQQHRLENGGALDEEAAPYC